MVLKKSLSTNQLFCGTYKLVELKSQRLTEKEKNGFQLQLVSLSELEKIVLEN